MGSAGSIFYPSNPDRRRRAEQLANDCEIAKSDYYKIRANIENFLKPLQGKLDDVLKALGCRTLKEFDELVNKTATGDALADWNRIKNQYDTVDTVEASIWATCGIIAIGGFVVSSVMGLFSFGIGFVAGIGVTASIIAVLGAVGLIFDAIFGAIERSQLREAIEDLCTARLQIKQLVQQSHAMELALPTINRLWDSIIDMGGDVDREVIIKMIADDKQGLLGEPWTYTRTAQGLVQMDRSRSSWTDEDPNFVSTAALYDMLHNMGLMSSVTVGYTSPAFSATASVQLKSLISTAGVANAQTSINSTATAALTDFLNKNPDVAQSIMSTPTYEDSTLKVVMAPLNGQNATGDILNKTTELTLEKTLSETRGLVLSNVNGKTMQYVGEIIDYKETGSVDTAFAHILLYSPEMPTKCLQPDGSFGLDKESGKILVKFA